MTDPALASRITFASDFERVVYQGCLATEMAKVNARNRYAPENSAARIEARAWDQTKACLKRMAERVDG